MNDNIFNKVISLMNIVHDYLYGINDSRLTTFLTDWPSKPLQTRTIRKNVLPVASYLKGYLGETDAKSKELLDMFIASENYLSWNQTYTKEDFGAHFLEKYGWAELIGKLGPIASDHFACGFLILGPENEYPKHSHEVDEVYVPLVSDALWLRDNGQWVYCDSGVPIFNKSWQKHGVRTESTPLVTLYLVSGGNYLQKSRIG